MNKIILTLFVLTIFNIGNAQTWIKFLQFKKEARITSTDITTDDGKQLLILTHLDKSRELTKEIIKIDEEGQIEWRTSLLPLRGNIKAIKFYKDKEERYLIAYESNQSSRIKNISSFILNSEGEILKGWSYYDKQSMRILGCFEFEKKLYFDALIGDSPPEDRIFIITDLDGKEIDYRNIEIPNNLNPRRIRDFHTETPNIYWVPHEIDGKTFLSKLKKEKKIIWECSLGKPNVRCVWRKTIESENYIYTFSGTAEGISISKHDNEGKTTWTSVFEPRYSFVKEIILDNGDIVIAAMRIPGKTEEKAKLIKIDSNGKVLWKKTYLLKNEDRLNDFFLTKDGGFLIVASVIDKRDSLKKVLLIKTDSNGETEDIDGEYEIKKMN